MDHGLMLYDFHARQYDLTIGRFTMVDPMAEKYPAISPYAYCLNNPLKVIDVDGRDIVILNAPNGAYGNGHMALLIGNQQKGWNYVSKDGSKWLPFWGPSKSSTPKNNKHKYSSLYDFDLSEDADINDGRYSQRLRFTTSEDEDNIALDAAVNSH
jgi:RHS repeat-associated protein